MSFAADLLRDLTPDPREVRISRRTGLPGGAVKPATVALTFDNLRRLRAGLQQDLRRRTKYLLNAIDCADADEIGRCIGRLTELYREFVPLAPPSRQRLPSARVEGGR